MKIIDKIDIIKYDLIVHRIDLVLREIFVNDSLNMIQKDMFPLLKDLDFGCIDRILESDSKLAIIIKPWKIKIFKYFENLKNGYFPPQMKSYIANIVAPHFKQIYDESKEITSIELHPNIVQFRKQIPEFDEFMKKSA